MIFIQREKIFLKNVAFFGETGYNKIYLYFMRNARMEERQMDVRPADILVMKKPHPCGSQTMYVIRIGMDFKLRCTGCGREFMIPRNKIERRIKKIQQEE